MNNLWKGLIVGALTGAFIGLTVDGLHRSREGLTALAKQVSEQRGDVAAGLTQAAAAGAAKLREGTEKAATSETARTIQRKAKELATTAAEAAKDAGRTVHESLPGSD